MELEDFDTLLPEELKGKPFLAAGVSRMFFALLKESSKRYELGIMTKDEAKGIVAFAYIPIRHMLVDLTWLNTELESPRLWTFGSYYEALGKLTNSE